MAAGAAEELRRASAAWVDANARGLMEDVLAELVRARPAAGCVRELVLRRVMATSAAAGAGAGAGAGADAGADAGANAGADADADAGAPLVLFAANEALFAGFVEQTGPACAAAVVAGAVNAVRDLHGDARFSQALVLQLLAQLANARVEKIQGRVERLLGQDATLEGLRRAVDASGIETLSALRRHVSAVPDADADAATLLLRELFVRSASAETLASARSADSQEVAEEEDDNDDDDDTVKTAQGDAWDHKKDLKAWLRKAHGLRRLLDEKKPSTACIGNWGIKGVVALISAEHSADFTTGLECVQLLGKSIACKVRVSPKDDADRIEQQWMALVTRFSRQQANHNATALVFHLKNHYAPIYALRARADGVREIFTSRKGQAPKHWISFDDVRSTMLRWNGHCIMAISVRSH